MAMLIRPVASNASALADSTVRFTHWPNVMLVPHKP
jgi:hypothetical protein